MRTSEKRLYVSSMPAKTPKLGIVVRNHWSIESTHWGLDYNLQQDNIKRKSTRAARNLDTIQSPILTDIPTKEAMEIAIQDNYDQVKQDVREIVLREKVRLAQEANSD